MSVNQPRNPRHQARPEAQSATQQDTSPFADAQVVVDLGSQIQMITATGEAFNHVDDNQPMWAGHGDRQVDIPILFTRIFKNAPAIQTGLSGIDCDHSANLRINIQARDVTENGFTLRIVTWEDTRIARAAISWSAIGAAR